MSTAVDAPVGDDARTHALAHVDDEGVAQADAGTDLELGERGEVVVLRDDDLATEVAA
jgi:hypothetical protein